MYGYEFVKKIVQQFSWVFEYMKDDVWKIEYQRDYVRDSNICQKEVSGCLYKMLFFYYCNKQRIFNNFYDNYKYIKWQYYYV